MGTPDFGLPALKKLIDSDEFEILAVITQPDRKSGRKMQTIYSPIKEEGLKNNIPVFQPEKIQDLEPKLKELKPDIGIVIAYKQIIPSQILQIPNFGFVNMHGSLLPKYRGSSCIQAAILNKDKESGITFMLMDKGLDTGPILAQNKIKLAPDETALSLYEKLSRLGANFLLPILKQYANNELIPQPQDDKKASYAPELKKEDGLINWRKDAEYLERFVRAMHSWPGAYTEINQGSKNFYIKIIKTNKKILGINKYKPGCFFEFGKQLAVQCGNNALIAEKIQPQGKKEMPGSEFAKGYKNLLTA